MTLQELLDYHQKQAEYFDPFGATNVLSTFHRAAVAALAAAIKAEASTIKAEREACAKVMEAEPFNSPVAADAIRMRANPKEQP